MCHITLFFPAGAGRAKSEQIEATQERFHFVKTNRHRCIWFCFEGVFILSLSLGLAGCAHFDHGFSDMLERLAKAPQGNPQEGAGVSAKSDDVPLGTPGAEDFDADHVSSPATVDVPEQAGTPLEAETTVSTDGTTPFEIPKGWPVDHPERKIISPFGFRGRARGGPGRYHSGVDIKAPRRTPVVATADGVVVYSGSRRGYGNMVVLRHSGGVETAYAHLEKREVKPGDSVQSGQCIGLLGNTGKATTYHVHYEIRINGEPVDPVPHLSG